MSLKHYFRVVFCYNMAHLKVVVKLCFYYLFSSLINVTCGYLTVLLLILGRGLQKVISVQLVVYFIVYLLCYVALKFVVLVVMCISENYIYYSLKISHRTFNSADIHH